MANSEQENSHTTQGEYPAVPIPTLADHPPKPAERDRHVTHVDEPHKDSEYHENGVDSPPNAHDEKGEVPR